MIKPKNKLGKKILVGLSVIALVLVGGFFIFVSDYYRASEDVSSIIAEYEGVIEQDGKYTVVYPLDIVDKKMGLVLYPGAKVEAKAYMPLLLQLAQEGVTSVLVEMPFNLAVFNINAANKAIELVPKIDDWYLAGHSLGGAMASSFINKNYENFEGLVLLAAYPINDADIDTLQIYGSNDLVLDQRSIVNEVPYYIVDGGNHAYFGNYGEQSGDGVATVSREDQQDQTMQQIVQFMGIVEQE